MSTALWVFVGRRILGDGKLYYTWYSLNTEGTDIDREQMHAFSKPLVKSTAVGAVYLVTSDSPKFTTVKQGGQNAPKYQRYLSTPAMREMLMVAEADEVEFERRQLLKKLDQNTLEGMTLGEMRVRYSEMLPDRRRAFLAWLLSQFR